MTTTVPNIDVSQPITEITEEMTKELERAGAPSPYFEELWNTLIVCLNDIDARLTAGGL